MSIVKRGPNVWLVRVYTGRDGGKIKQRKQTVHGTKDDAKRVEIALKRELDLIGVLVEPSRMSLNDYLDQWLATVTPPQVRQSTYRQWLYYLAHYVRPALGSSRLDSITSLALQKLYSGLEAPGLTRASGYVHDVLRPAFKQAVAWKMLRESPMVGVRIPKRQRKEMRALSPEEAERFNSGAVTDVHGTLFVFALTTGMRPGEYLALRWRNLDLQKGLVRVVRALDLRTGPN